MGSQIWPVPAVQEAGSLAEEEEVKWVCYLEVVEKKEEDEPSWTAVHEVEEGSLSGGRRLRNRDGRFGMEDLVRKGEGGRESL